MHELADRPKRARPHPTPFELAIKTTLALAQVLHALVPDALREQDAYEAVGTHEDPGRAWTWWALTEPR